MLMHVVNALGILKNLDIPEIPLIHFFILIMKGYNQVPFHNWHHALDVTQVCLNWTSLVSLLFSIIFLGMFFSFKNCESKKVDWEN